MAHQRIFYDGLSTQQHCQPQPVSACLLWNSCSVPSWLEYLELTGCTANAFSILAVHHINQPVGVVEVVPPEWTELFLAANIPHCEENVLVLHLLHVEA